MLSSTAITDAAIMPRQMHTPIKRITPKTMRLPRFLLLVPAPLWARGVLPCGCAGETPFCVRGEEVLRAPCLFVPVCAVRRTSRSLLFLF
ncbi:MAG: hypothetical protein RR848_09755 [Oscillospiraceae bacterium]